MKAALGALGQEANLINQQTKRKAEQSRTGMDPKVSKGRSESLLVAPAGAETAKGHAKFGMQYIAADGTRPNSSFRMCSPFHLLRIMV